MHIDVAKEIFETVRILPEDEQIEILQQARTLAKKGKKPSIWDKIHAHSAEIPDEEWDRMPVDGSEQHDHYLYGSPKK